jgi:uncharacterized protein YyaL (SSP411 family)
MPGFTELLRHVAQVYSQKRDAIREQNDSLRDIFTRLQPPGPAPGVHPGPEVLDQAHTELQRQFDARWGGFGGAPKFPHHLPIDHACTAAASVAMARKISKRKHGAIRSWPWPMRSRRSGHGGFALLVDERGNSALRKDLYDKPNCWRSTPMPGSQPATCSGASSSNGGMGDAKCSHPIYDITRRSMPIPKTRKFYVWTAEEIRRLLTADEWETVERRFGLKGTPNFEGRWHLNVHTDHATLALERQCTESDVATMLESARRKLYMARDKRVHPGRDEKILTSWNGLMIKGMARAPGGC